MKAEHFRFKKMVQRSKKKTFPRNIGRNSNYVEVVLVEKFHRSISS